MEEEKIYDAKVIDPRAEKAKGVVTSLYNELSDKDKQKAKLMACSAVLFGVFIAAVVVKHIQDNK